MCSGALEFESPEKRFYEYVEKRDVVDSETVTKADLEIGIDPVTEHDVLRDRRGVRRRTEPSGLPGPGRRLEQ